MSTNKKTFRRPPRAPLTPEAREEEDARLAREIAAHPVTKCKDGAYKPTPSRPGWSNEPLVLQADQANAERIAKKMRKS
ncbi:MAG: hypothetical protein V3S93_05515 [Methyloceanibacter sp.]|jgi:hypothetical protein